MKYDNVPLNPQTTNMSCWAASMSMILGWRDQASYSDELIAKNEGGTNYEPQYWGGLGATDRYILERNGFVLESPMCYTPGGILTLLSNYGPLWVATYAPGAHIRVVTGLVGDTVYINDPWPPNTGKQESMSFADFFGAMEELGRRDDDINAVYVAYLQP